MARWLQVASVLTLPCVKEDMTDACFAYNHHSFLVCIHSSVDVPSFSDSHTHTQDLLANISSLGC